MERTEQTEGASLFIDVCVDIICIFVYRLLIYGQSIVVKFMGNLIVSVFTHQEA